MINVSIRDYPVSLNKSCSFNLITKHKTESGTTLSLKESSGIHTEAVDVNFTDWNKKLQTEECAEYTGGEYCTVGE